MQLLQSDVSAEHDTIIRMESVGKMYGSFSALSDVSFSIRRGAIHGLLGENGAGKSTLVGIISGHNPLTSGHVYLNGEIIDAADVKTMEAAGVFLVTQEPMIIDHLSAAENLMLGIWPEKRGFVQWRKLHADAKQMLADTGINPAKRAGQLDAVARRKLNILRAMFSGGTVIILDEPTAALTVEDRSQLFDFMRRLKDDGVTFIFISHYNDEILDICDSVTVLRDGKLAGGSENLSDMTSEQLSELVLGRGLQLFQRTHRSFAQVETGVSIRDVRAGRLNLDRLDIHRGEILGFTGLPGAGAKELARSLFGLVRVESGTIQFEGDAAPSKLPRDPKAAFETGIAFLSDDRRKDGSVTQMSIGQNISLSSLDAVSRNGFLRPTKERELSDRYFASMGIKAAGPEAVVDTLSGGNQQKVCLGRVMATNPRLLILDEPTRGIDVGVKQDVLAIIDALSEQGVCVIIVSTDTDELARAADRVCIFAGGKIHTQLVGDEIETEKLRKLMGVA
ncbi:sugar ABC transporter ATP-binding protein [Aliiroseovarius sediminis]|uniref:sugar ABC transporter ATP-binding protein n=1 Tax=Aliiroseovarius sediminis TaxID=2925839 RepID=UPI001F56FDCF|nr:sugar ABC transporter ATP-binding protein [Aliiroseovarius sediminis]MCI2395051.1 sugar ABC transporter ATP-binding protein [Aliiroseovarius sediminis]